MALIAQVEGTTIEDGDVLVQATATLTSVEGFAHNGGASQAAADALLSGYWVIVLRDWDRDGTYTVRDDWGDAQYTWVAGTAVGWDGSAAELLPAGVSFALLRGEQYLIVVVAVAADGTKSAGVSWAAGAAPDVSELYGLTADGLAGVEIGDYEAARFRRNRIDPPTANTFDLG